MMEFIVGWILFVMFVVVLAVSLSKVLCRSLDFDERFFGAFCLLVDFMIILPCAIMFEKHSNKNLLLENVSYTLPDGNKIKIKQEGSQSVIMPANEVVKDK